MVEIDSLTVPLFLSGFERRGVSGALASFEDLDTAERAAELVGKELCIECDSEVEPEDDEFYMEDLIGFTVEAGTVQEGKMLHGRLTDYYDSEANPLFEIEFDGRGQWTEVKCKRSAVPASLVPQQIARYISSNYPDCRILEIERDEDEYEVKLSNYVEVTFDRKFNVIDID